MPRNPAVKFDRLQMYFGEPYVIDVEDAVGTVTVLSPTIGDIVALGEERFYQTLNIFICNTTQYRLVLWEMKPRLDWTEMPDFQLFVMLSSQIDPEVSKLLFGDLDFKKFQPMVKTIPADPEIEDSVETQELILWDDEDQIEINANVYNHFAQYLRTMFNIFPDEKITHDPILKQWYITKDKRALENAAKKKKSEKPQSGLQPVISALVNHPGFKYKLRELKEVGVAEFYDSVKRLQIYEQSTALMKGMFSGFVDGSKIKPEEYNFMRDI